MMVGLCEESLGGVLMGRIGAVVWVVLLLASVVQAQSAGSFITGSKEDETVIRQIVQAEAADKPEPRVAADLDWENAFGIRYNDLKKMRAFYGEVVSPLQKDDTDSTLEVKVKFLTPEVAVADEYWHIVGQLDVKTKEAGPDRWGRTTYIFKKENGTWTDVMERVADLRSPYYKHYDELPAAAVLPAGTLASYTGVYERKAGDKLATITVSGDHLTLATKRHSQVLIPTAATQFLLFDPEDLAEYGKVTFIPAKDGGMTLSTSDASGEHLEDLTRIK